MPSILDYIRFFQQRNLLKSQALLRQGQQESMILGVAGDLVKLGQVDAANEFYERYMGMPGPFKEPKLGETITKKPSLTMGPAGDVGYKEEKRGGVTVTPETRQRYNTQKALEEMGISIESPVGQFITGWKPVAERQPAAILQEYNVWKAESGNANKTILDFITERTKATQKEVGAPKTRTVRRGKHFITEEYQSETKTWKQIGKSAISQAGAGGGGTIYSKSQKMDDCRSFYAQKMQVLTRKYAQETQGFLTIPEGVKQLYEAEANRLLREEMEDLQKINRGEEPKYLTEQIDLPPPSKWKYVPGQGMIRVQ